MLCNMDRIDLKKSILHWRSFNKPTAIYYTVFCSLALLLASLECVPIVMKEQSLSALSIAEIVVFCLIVIALTFCICGLVRACKREK